MVQQVEQLSTGYPQLWDERVFCHECQHSCMVEQRQSMPTEQMERHRKVNAKPLQWFCVDLPVSFHLFGWHRLALLDHA